jgi:polysaccharide export outer membrane protein
VVRYKSLRNSGMSQRDDGSDDNSTSGPLRKGVLVMYRKVSLGPLASILLTLWLLSSGLSSAETAPNQARSAGGSQAGAPQVADKSSLIVTQDYLIGPEDVLEITVWRNADLSKLVSVRPDGRISLPLIGDVTAVGKTASQLAEDIANKLKEYKENPQVSIVVKEVNSYAIYVLGEVAKPGKYPLKSKTTLLQAITLASGFTPTAARNKIVVFRFGKDGEGQIKIKASYDDIVLRDGSNQNIELKPGDQIVVPSETMVLVP